METSFLSNALKAALVLGLLSLAACGGGGGGGGGGAPTAPSEPLADLMVTEVTGLPSQQWNARDSFTASVTVQNQGRGNAGIFRVGLYASEDRIITTDDELIGSSPTSDTLEGGGSLTVRITVSPLSVPSGLVSQGVEDLDRGSYYLGAIADIEGDVDEADEENNDDHARNNPPSPVRFDPSPLTIGGVLTGAITEGTASTSGTATATDGDGAADTFRTEVSPTTGSYGTLTITTAGVWTYTLDNSAGGATDRLAGDATATDAFTIMAADRTEATVTITITGVEDLSTLSGGFAGSVTEDSTTNATATGEITIADVDTTPLPTITAQTTTGTYGSFTIGKKTPSDEADRVYSWTYTLDNSDPDTNALAAGATMEDEFTITTSDGVNAKVTITITGADDSSTIGGALSGSVTEDDSANLTAGGTATVTDGDSEATFTAQTDTDGSYGTFSITTAGVWSYSLDNSPGDTRGDATNALKAGQTESETFPITTSDNSSATVTIAVNGANDAAVFGATGLTGSVTEDAAPNTVTGTAQATDVDGDDDKFIAVTAPDPVSGSYGSLTLTEDGAWTYSLDNSNATVNALGQGATLTDSLTIQAKDGTAGTITITITGANDAATFSGTQSGAVTEDATVNTATGTITVSDVDGDNALKEQADQTGSYGSLSVNHSTGVWTYTLTNSGDNARARATQALAGGATATETFTILAADDTPTTLTITITGANDAATIGGAVTGAINEGTASTTGTVTSTDVDGTDNAFRTEVSPNDGTTLTTGTGTYGTLTITSAGAWTYTLDNSAGGATDLLAGGATAPDAFTIMAADGTSGTVTITITGVDDPSTLSGGFAGSVTEDSTTNATATGEITVADIDTTPIPTITAQTTTGTYGSFTIGKKTPSDEADRVYSWTYTLDNADDDTNALAAGTIVEDEFTITTSDGVNAKVTITITGADDSSTIGGALSGSVTEDDSDDLTAERDGDCHRQGQ